MKRFCCMLLVCVFYYCGIAQPPASQKAAAEITMDVSKKIHPISKVFWGTNFLYWVDDDSALANGRIVSQLKAAHIGQLRYPGGTVADNFHWQTNTLENVNMFPYESGAAETDFDEFMQVCKTTGATASCVLNTETWAVKKDISGGAHEAADWLRYCKQKGYRVPYWEIGNETYWHPILSAAEYADLVNVYADSLRSVDASVILGVNGHWDVEFVGTKERINKEAYAQLMDHRRHITTRQEYQAYTAFEKANTILPVTTGNTKWWKTVAEKCGKNIDMIIVHWYFSPGQLPKVTEKLTQVRELFAKMYPGKKFLLNMSEYNVTEKTAASHLQLTEMAGAMLQAKTDLSALWPMRMQYKKPTLLDVKTDQPSILYHIYRQLAAHVKGSLVQTLADGTVPAFASADGNMSTLVMTGSKIKQRTAVTVKINGRQHYKACTVWRISGSEYDYKMKDETVPLKQGKAVITIAPGEVVMAVFK